MRSKLLTLFVASLLIRASALARENASPFPQRKDLGDVFGMVMDAKTGQPVEGVTVRLEEGGVLQNSGPTVAKTGANGRFQTKAHIGNCESHTKFRLAGVISGPLTKTQSSKTIDLTRVVVSVEKAGYRSFYGVVEVGYASPRDFAIYLRPIALSSEESGAASYARNGEPWECFYDPTMAPPFVQPGGKVTITLKLRAPFAQNASYEVFADSPLEVLGKKPPRLKPVADEAKGENDEITFRAEAITPKKPRDINALIHIYVFRDGEDITPDYLKPMLLQFASADEAQAAALCDEAWRLSEAKEIAAALDKAQKAAQIKPEYPTAWELVGRFAMKSNKPDEGLAALKKLVELRPDDYEGALATYADSLITAGRIDDAQKLLKDTFEKIESDKKLKEKPLENLRSVYARCLLSKGDVAGAEEQVKKAGVLPPAFVHRLNLERAKARKAASPDSVDAIAAVGRALADCGDWAQAVNELRAASAKAPNDHWLRIDLAAALMKGFDRPDLALPELKTAVELAPDNAEARLALADCLRLLGRFEEAASHYAKAAELQPSSFEARHWNGVLQLVLGNEEGAVLELREVVREGGLGRDKGDQKFSGQFYYYFSGETTRSLQSGFARFEAEMDYIILDSLVVLKTHPENAMAQFNLGSALVRLGLPEAGLKHLEIAAKSLSGSADVKSIVARARWKMGQTGEALALYDEALKANPYLVDVRTEIARLLAEQGDEGRAASLLMFARGCETEVEKMASSRESK